MVQSEAVKAFMKVDRLRLSMEKKRIAYRKPLGSAQHRVLQDMGHAGGIGGYGFKSHAEGVFVIVPGNVNMSGARCIMGQLGEPGADVRQIGNRADGIAAYLAADGEFGGFFGVGFLHEKPPMRLSSMCGIGRGMVNLPVADRLSGFGCILPAVYPPDFSHLIEAVNDIAQFFVVIASGLSNFGNADAVLAALNEV